MTLAIALASLAGPIVSASARYVLGSKQRSQVERERALGERERHIRQLEREAGIAPLELERASRYLSRHISRVDIDTCAQR